MNRVLCDLVLNFILCGWCNAPSKKKENEQNQSGVQISGLHLEDVLITKPRFFFIGTELASSVWVDPLPIPNFYKNDKQLSPNILRKFLNFQ